MFRLKSSTYHNNFVLSRGVVQVPWVPEVTECHVTPSGFSSVCVCSTGSCATSALCNGVWMRNRKLRRIRPCWGLLTGNDVTRKSSLVKYGSAHVRPEIPWGAL